jgi:hypothetical protein
MTVRAYLDHAGLGRLREPARSAMRAALDDVLPDGSAEIDCQFRLPGRRQHPSGRATGREWSARVAARRQGQGRPAHYWTYEVEVDRLVEEVTNRVT